MRISGRTFVKQKHVGRDEKPCPRSHSRGSRLFERIPCVSTSKARRTHFRIRRGGRTLQSVSGEI